MASSILSLLAGGMGSEEDYLAKDPFFMGGVNLAKQQVAPRNNTDAFLLPALQGLLSGGLAGFGRGRANEAAYQDLRSNPLLKDMLEGSYASETAPENWSFKQGQSDLLTSMLAGEQKRAQEERAQELQQKFDFEYSPEAMAAKAKLQDMLEATENKYALERIAAQNTYANPGFRPEVLEQLKAEGIDANNSAEFDVIHKAKSLGQRGIEEDRRQAYFDMAEGKLNVPGYERMPDAPTDPLIARKATSSNADFTSYVTALKSLREALADGGQSLTGEQFERIKIRAGSALAQASKRGNTGASTTPFEGKIKLDPMIPKILGSPYATPISALVQKLQGVDPVRYLDEVIASGEAEQQALMGAFGYAKSKPIGSALDAGGSPSPFAAPAPTPSPDADLQAELRRRGLVP